jgi:hypothetical protein
VRRVASSMLTPKHFRNQLKVFGQHVAPFRQIVEDTWPGLRVLDLRFDRNLPGESLSLMVRDEDFVAEVAAMGHGLQMWLQTMWFLARTPAAACVILDEPDVYMHPDLQRRLIRYLRRAHQSVKEIENFLLVPSAISRLINSRASARTSRVDAAEVATELDRICEALRDTVFDAIAAEIQAEDRRLGAAGANRSARQRIDSLWRERDCRLGVVPGKQVFSKLSAWSQEQFWVSLSALAVARSLNSTEVHLVAAG